MCYKKRKFDKEGEEGEEDETKWREIRKVLNDEDKKKLLGKVIEIGVRIFMRNHLY